MCFSAVKHIEIMGIVAHGPGVVFARQARKFFERGQIAIHREHAVGHDQRVRMSGTVRGKKRACMIRIIVAECYHRAARKLRTRPKTGVGKFIDQQKIVLAQQGGNNPGIGKIAGAEHASRILSFQRCKAGFQFAV